MASPATSGGLAAALPYAAVLALLLSAGLTRLALAYAERRRMVDLPGARRSHAAPTPRGGGAGPVLAMLIVGFGLAWPFDPSRYFAFASAFALAAGLGWWDDHRNLGVGVRLAAQLAICGGLAWFLLTGSAGALPTIACVAWLLLYLNLHNFMDGINGLAAAQTAFCAGAFALLAGEGGGFAPYWLCVVGAVAALGFLPFNFPRARIFMGDVGSTALGLWLAAMAVLLAWSGALAAGSALIVMSAFVVDGAMTLGYRVLRGKRWWRPHREHLYQWLARAGWTHVRVVGAYFAWNVLLALPLAWMNERLLRSAYAGSGAGTLGYTAALPALVLALAAVAWLLGKRWCRRRVLGIV